MPHRRTVNKGSFGSHFDEMVGHFTPEPSLVRTRPSDKDRRELRETLDIHALLFERAWSLDGGSQDRNGR